MVFRCVSEARTALGRRSLGSCATPAALASHKGAMSTVSPQTWRGSQG